MTDPVPGGIPEDPAVTGAVRALRNAPSLDELLAEEAAAAAPALAEGPIYEAPAIAEITERERQLLLALHRAVTERDAARDLAGLLEAALSGQPGVQDRPEQPGRGRVVALNEVYSRNLTDPQPTLRDGTTPPGEAP